MADLTKGSPSPISFTIEPFEDEKVLYLSIAPPGKGTAPKAMVYFMLTITNKTGKTLALEGIEVSFPGTTLSSRNFFRNETLAPGTRQEWLEGDEVIPLNNIPPKIKVSLLFGDRDPVWRIWDLAAHKTSYELFARPESNPDFGEAIFFQKQHAQGGGDQHFGYDAGVMGWNHDTGEWSSLRTAGSSNADTFLWERPIYAMADGIVLKAVDGNEDNPSQDERAFRRAEGQYTGTEQITAVAVANLAPPKQVLSRMVVACITAPARLLQLTALEQTHDANTLGFVGQVSGPPAEKVSVAPVDEHRAVTATQADTDARLILWSIPQIGTITQLSEVAVPGVVEIKVVKLSETGLMTAARTSAGKLSLSIWGIDGNKLISLGGEVSDEAIGAFDIVVLKGAMHVVTAVQESGRLKLISWEIEGGMGDSSGWSSVGLFRRGEKLGPEIGEVAIAETSVPYQVATAVRSKTGKLMFIVWDVDLDGKILHRKEATTDDQASRIDLAFFKTFTLASVFQNESGNLKIVNWEPKQEKFTKAVTINVPFQKTLGRADLIAVDQVPTNQKTLITAIRQKNGTLKVSLWQFTDSNLIYILYGNEIVHHVHLRQGSIPKHLLEAEPTVKRGDLIGEMGHSGKSSGPHLHIHALRVRPDLLQDIGKLREKVQAGEIVGSFRPLQFHGVRAMRNEDVKPGGAGANSASTLNGQGFYFNDYVVWP